MRRSGNDWQSVTGSYIVYQNQFNTSNHTAPWIWFVFKRPVGGRIARFKGFFIKNFNSPSAGISVPLICYRASNIDTTGEIIVVPTKKDTTYPSPTTLVTNGAGVQPTGTQGNQRLLAIGGCRTGANGFSFGTDEWRALDIRDEIVLNQDNEGIWFVMEQNTNVNTSWYFEAEWIEI